MAESSVPTQVGPRNATPRPWALDTIEGGGWAVVVEADGSGAKVVAELDDTYGDRAANAALIVEAVNAYEQERRVVERIKARIKWRTRSRDGASVHWVTLEEVSALLEEGA